MGLGIREELVLLVSLGGQRIWKVLIDRPKENFYTELEKIGNHVSGKSKDMIQDWRQPPVLIVKRREQDQLPGFDNCGGKDTFFLKPGEKSAV